MNRRLARAVVGVAALALVLAGAGGARTPKDPLPRHNAADMTTASRIVVKRSDVGAGWTAKKPDTSDETCAAQPDQSDLVETGFARSRDFASTKQGRFSSISSEARLFSSAREAATAWSRSANVSRLRACAVEDMRKQSNRQTTFRLISLTRLRVPRVAARTFAIRAVIRVSGAGGTGDFVTDLLAIGRHRAVATVTFVSLAPQLELQYELNVARAVAGRLPRS